MDEKQLSVVTKLCDELNLDLEEVIENIDDEKDDFTVGDYRFIHQDEIDQILEDELGCDAYILGCFNAWFIVDNTDLSIDIVEALQNSEQYEIIGRHILDNDYLEDFAKAYSDADGYGHHFNHWDGGQIEDILSETGYYVFRIN
jgi:hypothetical protein